MENPSVSLPDQSTIFDSATGKNMLALNSVPASAMPRNDCVQDVSGRGFIALERDAAMAVSVSVLLHIVAVVFLYLFASQSLLPVINEGPQILQVTWVDASRLSGQDSLAGHVATVHSPAVAVQKMLDAEKEHLLPEKRMISSVPEERKNDPVLNHVDPVPATETPGELISSVIGTGHDKKHMVTVEQSLKTSGADNSAAYTSMAKPRYRENVPPPYPVSARLRGYEGVVLISAEILAEGRVGSLKIKSSSGYGILDQSALEAVKVWKFDPAKKMGKPVSAWVNIPVRFALNN